MNKLNLVDIIRILYGTQLDSKEIELRDDGDGIYIHKWPTDILGQQPSEQDLLDQIPTLQAQHDSTIASRNRREEYPKVEELVIALWEKVVGGNATEADKLEAGRQRIKLKYPKP